MLDKLKKPWYNNKRCETLAQSVEHTPFKRRVEGSNPSCLTSGEPPQTLSRLTLCGAFAFIRV